MSLDCLTEKCIANLDFLNIRMCETLALFPVSNEQAGPDDLLQLFKAKFVELLLSLAGMRCRTLWLTLQTYASVKLVFEG